MNILVIGGTKFIGTHVVRQLINMGHEVTVFNRGQTTAKPPEEVKSIKGDRHNLLDYRSPKVLIKVLYSIGFGLSIQQLEINRVFWLLGFEKNLDF